MKKIQLVLGGIFLILLGFLGGYFLYPKITGSENGFGVVIAKPSNIKEKLSEQSYIIKSNKFFELLDSSKFKMEGGYFIYIKLLDVINHVIITGQSVSGGDGSGELQVYDFKNDTLGLPLPVGGESDILVLEYNRLLILDKYGLSDFNEAPLLITDFNGNNIKKISSFSTEKYVPKINDFKKKTMVGGLILVI